MKLLTTATDIRKKIAVVESTGTKFQNAVQLAGVSIVAHIAQHRDKTLLTELYNAMPNGSRRKTMVDWLNANVVGLEAKYTKSGKLDVTLADVKSAEWAEFTSNVDAVVQAMTDKPWYEYAPERGEQDKVTMDAVIAYLEKKSKAANDDTADKIGQVVEFARALKA